MSRRHDEFEEFARARTPQLYRSAWMLCGDAHRAEESDLVFLSMRLATTPCGPLFQRHISP